MKTVEVGDYGICKVIKGKYSGETVFYDDDDDESGEAICYRQGQFLGGYYLMMPHDHLSPITDGKIEFK